MMPTVAVPPSVPGAGNQVVGNFNQGEELLKAEGWRVVADEHRLSRRPGLRNPAQLTDFGTHRV